MRIDSADFSAFAYGNYFDEKIATLIVDDNAVTPNHLCPVPPGDFYGFYTGG
jgi:hypothetical protein